MAKPWTDGEEGILRQKYLTHSPRELVLALLSAGHIRTISAVRWKCCEMGLCRSDDILPFCCQVTLYCNPGDPFISKVERDLRRQETPYIVAVNYEFKQAIFRQPSNGEVRDEPVRKCWVRWYNHPVVGTWPSYA